MSQKLPALATPLDPQVMSIDGAILLQTYDQIGIVTAAGATVTLPQNPQPGESHALFANGAVNFLVSGGGAFPLPVDPLNVGPGGTITFTFGTTAWKSDQGSSASAALDAYGDGSDGAAVLDGVAAFATFTSKVGSVYTLTRDAYLTNLTVNLGVTLVGASFRLFVNGVLTNNGTIHNDGNAAALGVAGALVAAGTLGASFAGGAGAVGNAVGTAGTNATQGLDSGTGAGGAGGAGGVNAGGAASTYTSLTASQGSVRTLPSALTGSAIAAGGVTALKGGAGGGGGGGDNAGITGGGGGGGGGVLLVAAFALQNNGVIRAAGGAGASATGAGGNGGSGGGGGGGDVLLITRAKAGAGTVTAPGGAAGAAVIAAGVLGTAGAAGNVLQLTA